VGRTRTVLKKGKRGIREGDDESGKDGEKSLFIFV